MVIVIFEAEGLPAVPVFVPIGLPPVMVRPTILADAERGR